MDAVVNGQSSNLRSIGQMGMRLWWKQIVLDFLHPKNQITLEPDWYDARLVYTIPKGVPWILLGDGTYGRPLSGWKRALKDGDSMFFDSNGRECESVQDIEKLAG